MSPPKSKGPCLVSLLLILACACSFYAQSGRRLPKSQPSPTPVSAPTTNDSESIEKLASAPAARTLKHQVKLLVGRELTSKHLPSEDTIYTSFIKRLNDFTNVTGTAIGDVKRQQAIQRAREEAESLVVLLQFEIDSVQDGKLVIKSSDLEVKYFVFAPGSEKLLTRGKVYYQAIGGRGTRKDNWPSGPPIRITAEAAGLEAAERLHDWLLLETPTDKKTEIYPLNSQNRLR